MVGIARKHEYRFKYLKSDEWQTVRSEALLRENACCQICGVRDISNDAHHVAYPESFWDTKAYHLVILCRPCHTLCHEILGFDSDKDHSLKRFLEVSEALRVWINEHKTLIEAPPIKRPFDYLLSHQLEAKMALEKLKDDWKRLRPNVPLPPPPEPRNEPPCTKPVHWVRRDVSRTKAYRLLIEKALTEQLTEDVNISIDDTPFL